MVTPESYKFQQWAGKVRPLCSSAPGCPSPPSGGFSFLPELTAAQFKFKVRDLVSNSSTSKEIKNRYDPKRRVGFFLRVCAGRRDAFFSNWSVCRCALSAFVRFSDMRIVSHRSWTLGYTWGRASLRLICCGMRDALVDRKHELKRLLLRVPASAPLRYADHVEAAGVACAFANWIWRDCRRRKGTALMSPSASRARHTRFAIGPIRKWQAMRNYSSEIAGVSLPLDGIRVSWRVLVSKARHSPRSEQLRF